MVPAGSWTQQRSLELRRAPDPLPGPPRLPHRHAAAHRSGPLPGGPLPRRIRKRRSLQRLRSDFPGVRWLLAGDDGENDPAIYEGFAREHPEHVLAIALRQVGADVGRDTTGDSTNAFEPADGGTSQGAVPLARGTNGHVLLRRRQASSTPVTGRHPAPLPWPQHRRIRRGFSG